MRAEERSTKSAERCDRHPGSRAVASCDRCGRPMCVACATPVRGETYGAECLAEILGPSTTLEDGAAARAPDTVARTIARIAFGLAVVATVLPWSRFGPGSGPFGAWSRSMHWSLLAGVFASAGLLLVLMQVRPRLRTPRSDAAAIALAALVTVCSLLAVLFPPDFSRPWLGPWAAVGSGALAAGASLLAVRAAERSGAGI